MSIVARLFLLAGITLVEASSTLKPAAPTMWGLEQGPITIVVFDPDTNLFLDHVLDSFFMVSSDLGAIVFPHTEKSGIGERRETSIWASQSGTLITAIVSKSMESVFSVRDTSVALNLSTTTELGEQHALQVSFPGVDDLIRSGPLEGVEITKTLKQTMNNEHYTIYTIQHALSVTADDESISLSPAFWKSIKLWIGLIVLVHFVGGVVAVYLIFCR